MKKFFALLVTVLTLVTISVGALALPMKDGSYGNDPLRGSNITFSATLNGEELETNGEYHVKPGDILVLDAIPNNDGEIYHISLLYINFFWNYLDDSAIEFRSTPENSKHMTIEYEIPECPDGFKDDILMLFCELTEILGDDVPQSIKDVGCFITQIHLFWD